MTTNYSLEAYSLEQKQVDDSAFFAKKMNLMFVFFELDLTDFRAKIKKYNKSATIKVSLITMLLHCFAQTLNKHKRSMALKSARDKLFLFEDADIFFPYEATSTNPTKKDIARYIFRAANTKTYEALEMELREMPKSRKKIKGKEKIFMQLPTFLRHFFYKRILNRPLQRKALFGNVFFGTVSNLVAENCTTFGYTPPFHSVGLFVSSLNIDSNNNDTRTKTGFTFTADHAIINGLDMAKLIQDYIDFVRKFSF